MSKVPQPVTVQDWSSLYSYHMGGLRSISRSILDASRTHSICRLVKETPTTTNKPCRANQRPQLGLTGEKVPADVSHVRVGGTA